MFHRSTKCMLFVAAIVLCLSGWAQSNYPNQPIKIVVPFAPGANTDLLARMYAKVIGEALNQRVLVENKPGRWRVLRQMGIPSLLHNLLRMQPTSGCMTSYRMTRSKTSPPLA